MGLSYWCSRCCNPAYTKTASTNEWVCEDHYREIERGW